MLVLLKIFFIWGLVLERGRENICFPVAEVLKPQGFKERSDGFYRASREAEARESPLPRTSSNLFGIVKYRKIWQHLNLPKM